MDQEIKSSQKGNETSLESSSATEPNLNQDVSDRKDDDEEEEEEEEEDKIVEKSHNSRFHKRNKRFPKQMEGVDNAFIAIEPKSGKEVIWNECFLSEKKTDKENRYLSIIKKLKKSSHPFLARFLDAWIAKVDDGSRKLVFITERLDECSLKQFLCNSARNNRLWKRHVGQILSVLMFLHRLGITHGNLSKESIYYQNSGNLRVGPFALVGCLDQKSQSADLLALGLVALEIAVWTPAEFPQSLPPTERCQQMLSKLENCAQRDFIEACLDPNLNTRAKMKRLINHPAVTEVPILKLLSAKVIVGTMRSVTSEDGSTAEQTGFATLLKDYLSHYEDETVIVEVHFPHDNVVNSRSWKDFRSNFTLTSKFLEDVKNGFYPLFGCRWNWATEQEEDEESLGGCATAPNGMSTTNPVSGIHRMESAVMTSVAHSSATSTAPSACVSRRQSNMTKNVDAVQGSHAVLEGDKDTGELKSPMCFAAGRPNSLCEYPSSRQSTGLSRIRQSDAGVMQFTNTSTGVVGRRLSRDGSIRLTGSNTTPGSKLSDVVHPSSPIDPPSYHSPSPGLVKTSGSPLVDTATGPPETSLGVSQANVSSLIRSASPAFCAPTADGSVKNARDSTHTILHDSISSMGKRSTVVDSGPNVRDLGTVREAGSLPDLSRLSATTDLTSENMMNLFALDSKRFARSGLGQKMGSDQEDADNVGEAKDDADDEEEEEEEEELEDDDDDEDEEEEEEEELEDDDDDEDEDDDEEDDDEKKVVNPIERFEPQTVHVVPPEHAPNHPALFTHCQYFYIGAGRWQVYVQMWFVEDRLKREAYVQVFEHEWHDYERVADLFEASRCLNHVDRPGLVRLLSLARHNCALIDGELRIPGPLASRSTNFDLFELHEKLTALQLHQQARDQLQREIGSQDGGTAPESACDPSLSASGLDTGQPGSVPVEKDASHERFGVDTRPGAPNDVLACADHAAQLQQQQQRSQKQPGQASSPPQTSTKPTVHDESNIPKESLSCPGQGRVDVRGTTNALFLDVGALAPRNAYCALCDTHEYLHRVDLPAYLISPCYHCRESLAREAKISPEILLDLHLRHSIPWPAFLQARFNLPLDGRPIEELISYDCRWRSRQPCRCLVPSGGPLLPPCVEFPWLSPPPTATPWDLGSGPSEAPNTQPIAAQDATTSGLASSNMDTDHAQPISTLPDNLLAAPTEAKANPLLTEGTQGSAAGQPSEAAAAIPPNAPGSGPSRTTLPCAHRHPRGAPTTCCHGIHFPTIGVAGSTHCRHSLPTSQTETCPTTAPQTGVSGAHPGPVAANGAA